MIFILSKWQDQNLILCKVHIIFEFSTLIFVIARFNFYLSFFKIEALIFVQNRLKKVGKFSRKSLVKMKKILYNVYIVNNNGSESVFQPHLNVQILLYHNFYRTAIHFNKIFIFI